MPHVCSRLTTGQTFALAFTAAVSLRLDTLPDTMSGTMVIPSMSSLNKIHTHTHTIEGYILWYERQF